MRLFGPLYDRVLSWAKHPHAERYLGGLSFAESSFFPIPPDVMLAPMCIANRPRAWRFATITTLTSLAGGVAGYAIGYFLFEAIEPWLHSMGYWPAYLRGKEWFDTWGIGAVFVAGFSPIPYKIFTISAGVAVLNSRRSGCRHWHIDLAQSLVTTRRANRVNRIRKILQP